VEDPHQRIIDAIVAKHSFYDSGAMLSFYNSGAKALMLPLGGPLTRLVCTTKSMTTATVRVLVMIIVCYRHLHHLIACVVTHTIALTVFGPCRSLQLVPAGRHTSVRAHLLIDLLHLAGLVRDALQLLERRQVIVITTAIIVIIDGQTKFDQAVDASGKLGGLIKIGSRGQQGGVEEQPDQVLDCTLKIQVPSPDDPRYCFSTRGNTS